MESESKILCEILPAIIGVFGAILGVILGFLLNRIFSAGKIKIYVYKIDKILYMKTKMGSEIETTEIDDACRLILYFDIDLYNSSSDFRIIRNLKMKHNNKTNKNKLREITKNIHGNTTVNPITYVNVPPKTVKNLRLQLIEKKKEEINELYNAKYYLNLF